MPDARFDAIAQNLAEGMAPLWVRSSRSPISSGAPPRTSRARSVRWTHHHVTCALAMHADVCDCGLDDELDKYVR